MPSVGYEPAIPANKLLYTNATAIRILSLFKSCLFLEQKNARAGSISLVYSTRINIYVLRMVKMIDTDILSEHCYTEHHFINIKLNVVVITFVL
jgi:hypothetical protein